MDEITRYQIRSLQDEIAFLRRRLDFVPAPVYGACVQFRQFRWTMSRLLGLDRQRAHAAPTDLRLETIPVRDASSPRVLFDVTDTASSQETTGVRRVVRELCRAAAEDRSGAAVRIADGRFVALDGAPIEFAPGDSLVLLDAGWLRTALYVQAVGAARAAGCRIVLGLYDLIPVNQPGFTPFPFVHAFEAWMRAILPLSDAVVAISHAVAADFVAWAPGSGVDYRPGLRVGWFTLGADLDKRSTSARSPGVRALLASAQRFYLSVGTLEPRKGHAVALDAFERYWAAGGEAAYVVAGRRGYASDALIERIETHAEYGRRLFWFSDAGDLDLVDLYAATAALVYPSIAEGFGLPLVEAAHFGAPVVASDIPVLREVGEGQVEYFRVLDSGDLAAQLAQFDRKPRTPPALAAASWRQAAAELTQLVSQDKYQTAIDGVRQ